MPGNAPRLIFHCDCNNFFASCECLDKPELKNVPMAVAGNPEDRVGVVVAKNELAKKAGVRTTDTVWQARKKCPGIVFVPPRHHIYKAVSDRVNLIYRDYSDYVIFESANEELGARFDETVSFLGLDPVAADVLAFADVRDFTVFRDFPVRRTESRMRSNLFTTIED